MLTETPGEVTQLLRKWRGGDQQALNELIPLVYGELQRLAGQCLRGERPGHTMQTNTLVHEAYLQLIGAQQIEWHDRSHFFAIATRLMRRVLVGAARERHCQKRGGEFTRIAFDQAPLVSPAADAELLALNEALEHLEEFAPRKCRVVELRYFGGLSIEETAAALDIAEATVRSDWRAAKLWLLRELTRAEGGNDGSATPATD